jgi:hypothetical protein
MIENTLYITTKDDAMETLIRHPERNGPSICRQMSRLGGEPL